ncbi:hypothetical protein ACKRZS_006936 [Fusarium odoratissimum]
MSNPSLGADALVDQAECFKTFLGLNQPELGDKFLFVMGLTGAGKKNHSPRVIQLQREVVDEKKNLGETAAGIAAAEYLYKARLEHNNQLKRLNTELERTSLGSDKEYSLQQQELKAEVDKEIQQTEQGRRAMVKTMVDLHQTETRALKQRILNLRSQFEAEVQNKEMMLQDVQESCDALQKEVARLTNHPQQQQLVARRTKTD